MSGIPPVVAIERLTKRYSSRAVVDDLTFTLDEGQIAGFLGPNGAGKSTILRLLLGLAAPSSGMAHILGRPFAELPEPARAVGAVLESGDFHPARSGRDHLRVLALAAGVGPARVDGVLETVKLTEAGGRPVRTYSLGMRQRLGLAAALLGDPRLLVLDEPANGLDPAGVHWLRGFLRAYADQGGTVLVSSHLLGEVTQTVDRVLILSRGRLVADRPIADFAQDDSLESTYLALTTAVTA